MEWNLENLKYKKGGNAMPLRAKHAREDLVEIEARVKEGKATISDVAKVASLIMKTLLDIRTNQVKIAEASGVKIRADKPSTDERDK